MATEKSNTVPSKGPGPIPPASRRPTMLDVARAAGVSKTTVSHVLNDSRAVSDEARDQVLRAMEALRYRPDPTARALRRGQAGTIGLLVPNVNSPLTAAILNELDALAAEHGIGIVVAQSRYSPSREREWLNILAAQRLDVLLVWPVGPDGEVLSELQHDGQRLVQIVSPSNDFDVPKVAADLKAAGRIAIEHLWGHGHRRIAVLPGMRHTAAQALAGVFEFSAEHDGDIELLIVRSDDTMEGAQRGVVKLLRRRPYPDAILTLTVTHFEAALVAIRSRGLVMPDDVALLALSDQTWLPYLTPSITAVRQNAHGMAQTAIELVRRILAGETVEPGPRLFAPSLVLGGSCGCCH